MSATRLLFIEYSPRGDKATSSEFGRHDVTFAQSTGLAFSSEPLVEVERQADAWIKAHLDQLLRAAARNSSAAGQAGLIAGAAEVK